MHREKRLLLGLLGAAHSLNHSLFLILPPLLSTVVGDLESSFEAVGLVVTVSGLIYGAGNLVGGSLSDRVGEVKVIRISLALAGASGLIFLVTRGILVFSIGMLLMSAWASLYHAAANNLISKVFQRGMAEAMGLHGVGGNLGYMLTPSIAVILGLMFGWRSPFLLFGLLSLAVSFLLPKMSLQTKGGVSLKSSVQEVFNVPGLWLLIFFNVTVGLYFRGIDLFFPTFLSQTRSFSGELAAHATTLMLALGVLGQWIGGRAADRFGSDKALLTLSTGVLAGLFLLLASPHPLIGVPLFILLYGLSFYGHQPAFNALAGSITPDKIKGVTYGILFFVSFGLGSISTTIAGYCTEIYGIEIAFYIMIFFSTVAFLLSALILIRGIRS